MLGGVVWAFLQPYRITLLHPHGQGFWWLAIEPPLLVVVAGIVFAFLVAPGVIEDLEAEDRYFCSGKENAVPVGPSDVCEGVVNGGGGYGDPLLRIRLS